MKPIHFLGLLFLVVGYFTYQVFYPFLAPITIAILLALATYKIHYFFLLKLPGKVLPAVASTLFLALIFFAPILYIITNAASLISKIDFASLSQMILSSKEWLEKTLSHQQYINFNLTQYLNQIDIKSIFDLLIKTSTYFGTMSANFIKDIFLILIFYFFANFYGRDLLLYLQDLIPFKKEDSKKLFSDLAGVMGVVFNSIIATAIFEGALFGIIVQFFGYNGLVFGILYGFSSLIPVIGGLILWLPLSLYSYFNGDTTGAITIALYSVVVISIIADTFIKPLIIKYIDELLLEDTTVRINELLIFFAIVAGLSSYGFWGMIIGPAVITLLMSILNIYTKMVKNRVETL